MAEWKSEKILRALALEKGCRTVAEIAEMTGASRKDTAKACAILLSRGLADRPKLGCYCLNEAGRIALEAGAMPRSGPRGPKSGRPRQVKNSLRSRLWAALRRLKKASLADLLPLAANGREQNALSNGRQYLIHLRKAGIIVALEQRDPGESPTSNGYLRHMLLRDLGPLAPIHSRRRNGLFDPNSGEILPYGGLK